MAVEGTKRVQEYAGWREFKVQPIEERLKHFEKNNKPFDLLFAAQLKRDYWSSVFEVANKIRTIAKNKVGLDYLRTTMSDKRAMLFFSQPSTRTFLSFQNACHMLGIQTSTIRDSSTSSEIKGESPEDTIRTFSSYVDLIIMRHKEEGYAEKSAWLLNNTKRPVPVINGGSGKDEHPTQALLDLYTLERAFWNKGGLDGKTVALVGDLKRGRTVRSLAQLLTQYHGVRLLLIAPKTFQMREDILAHLDKAKMNYEVTEEFEKNLPHLDAIYMTRIQDEYDEGGESKSVDNTVYHFEKRHLAVLRPTGVILHPFPRRFEIDVAVDADPRALYWKQERNGMWVRSALILKIFAREAEILHSDKV